MTTGQLIRHYRKKRGLTQKQLGDKCGMADSAIRRYESDRGNPTIETLAKLADALHIQTWDLFDGSFCEDFGLTDDTKTEAAIAPVLEVIAEDLRLLNLDGHVMACVKVKELTQNPKYQKETPPEDTEA